MLQTPEFSAGFCSSLKVHYIGVQRKGNTFYKYIFDQKSQRFEVLNCLECQPCILESDLHPLYAIHRKEFKQPTLFVKNVITNQIEQYIYSKILACFEEVYFPMVQFNPNMYNKSEVLYTVDESKNGRTFIARHENGHLIKQRYSKYSDNMEEYRDIGESKVRTLAMKRACFESVKLQGPQEAPRAPRAPSREFITTYCTVSHQKVILVPHGDSGYCRYIYDYSTNEFKPHRYQSKTVTEKHLYPLYTQTYCNVTGGQLTFVRNLMNCAIEKYTYDPVENCLCQIDRPEVEYDPKHEIPDGVLFMANSNTVVMKDFGGNFKIQKFDWKENMYRTVGPVKVLSFQNAFTTEYYKSSDESEMSSSASSGSSSDNSGSSESQIAQLTDLVKDLTAQLAHLQDVVLKKENDSSSNVSIASSKDASTETEFDLLEELEKQH